MSGGPEGRGHSRNPGKGAGRKLLFERRGKGHSYTTYCWCHYLKKGRGEPSIKVKKGLRVTEVGGESPQ